MFMKTMAQASAAIGALAALVATQPVNRHVTQWEDVDRAVAVIQPTSSGEAAGEVFFRDVRGGVRVIAHVRNLEPFSVHGFHIHRYGDATASDGTSAGGHYDPLDTGVHARPNAPFPHHLGDLGNISANADGEATYNRVIRGITVAGLRAPLIGRAVVVHADPDEFEQPSGDAGGRIGIGVIGVANPDTSFALPDLDRDGDRREGVRRGG